MPRTKTPQERIQRRMSQWEAQAEALKARVDEGYSLPFGEWKMGEIVVRGYRPEDRDACRELWAELTERHRELYSDPDLGGEAPGLYFDHHLEAVGLARSWVADQDGEVVGLTGLLVHGQTGEVEPVTVSASWRGQGIGGALVARAAEEARRLGLRHLSVRPVARNAEAIAFFHRAGFRALGQIELVMELAETAVIPWRPGPELHGLAFEW